jgi:xanthine dehydrogenase molybdopterin-binding subunit B
VAAKLVTVQYAKIEGKKPIFTVAEALYVYIHSNISHFVCFQLCDLVINSEAKSFFVPTHEREIKNGEADVMLKVSGIEKVQGHIYMGSQSHFYMEPQTSYAVPDEDNRMQVHHTFVTITLFHHSLIVKRMS